jgi:glycosyltransferase involved in cell wall biosynthesis
MKISFAICVHNEDESLKKLLDQLTAHIDDGFSEDEIVLVDDNSTNPKTIEILEKFKEYEYVRVYTHSLDKDFARHKNYLNSMCVGDWIFNIDADELLADTLLEHCSELIEANPENELFWFPRVNIVNGITLEHIKKWGWAINYKSKFGPAVNFPDLQGRLYKREDKIRWIGKVHERIEGAEVQMTLPYEEDWCIIHIKDIERQEKQNSLYSQI